MSRWFDRPDGWRDRVQSVVCAVFGCACADPDNHSRPAASQRPPAVASSAFSSRAAAVDVSESDADPDGEAVPAWAGTSSGAVPMAVPAHRRQGGTRTRKSARCHERVGVVVVAAPTTRQREVQQ